MNEQSINQRPTPTTTKNPSHSNRKLTERNSTQFWFHWEYFFSAPAFGPCPRWHAMWEKTLSVQMDPKKISPSAQNNTSVCQICRHQGNPHLEMTAVSETRFTQRLFSQKKWVSCSVWTFCFTVSLDFIFLVTFKDVNQQRRHHFCRCYDGERQRTAGFPAAQPKVRDLHRSHTVPGLCLIL